MKKVMKWIAGFLKGEEYDRPKQPVYKIILRAILTIIALPFYPLTVVVLTICAPRTKLSNYFRDRQATWNNKYSYQKQTNCPNCAAPIKSNICEYCGTKF